MKSLLDFNFLYEKAIYGNLKMHKKGRVGKLLAICCGFILRLIFNCDISVGASIEKNVKIPHAVGIVIGSTAIIEKGVVIMPNVIIGAKYYPPRLNEAKRHATIRRNVLLGANSTIIGNVTIGENAVIAAGAVVTIDIPADAIVVGNNIIYHRH